MFGEDRISRKRAESPHLNVTPLNKKGNHNHKKF